jgi:hypothetical protein
MVGQIAAQVVAPKLETRAKTEAVNAVVSFVAPKVNPAAIKELSAPVPVPNKA